MYTYIHIHIYIYIFPPVSLHIITLSPTKGASAPRPVGSTNIYRCIVVCKHIYIYIYTYVFMCIHV